MLTHVHSPYSWDACDGQGLRAGQPDPACLRHLFDALCANRVDHAFLSDHPDAMAMFGYEELSRTLTAPDVCSNGHRPATSIGFEDRLMALGMNRHLADTSEARLDLYKRENRAIVGDLRSGTGAWVAIPHTESRSVELLKELAPDAIEVFNLHALLDFKIRGPFLGAAPFRPIPTLVGFFLDPFAELEPDLMFLFFLETFESYFEKWDALGTSGLRVTGIASTDAHENVMKQTLWDGERVDSFRRTTRLVSNLVLTERNERSEIQSAIVSGRVWMAFEALGSPVDFDFVATDGSSVTEVGGATQLAQGLELHVSRPSLHSTWRSGVEPWVRMDLVRASADGKSQVVKSSEESFQFVVAEPGLYRVVVSMVPRHLRSFLGDLAEEADREFPWLLSNPIEVRRP